MSRFILSVGVALFCTAALGTATAAQKAPPAKIHRYCDRVIRKHDTDRDGRLDRAEWARMHGNPGLADFDRDGLLTVEELARHVVQYGRRRKIRLVPPPPGELVSLPSLLNPDADAIRSRALDPWPLAEKKAGSSDPTGPSAGPPAKNRARRHSKYYVPRDRRLQGVPTWFYSRDDDGDGQLTLAEYAPQRAEEDLKSFARLDRDGDGLITPKECLRAPAAKTQVPATKTQQEEGPDEESQPEETQPGE